MDTATKTGMGAVKIASKRVVQKTAELKIIQLIKLHQQVNQKKKKNQKKQKKFTFHQKKATNN